MEEEQTYYAQGTVTLDITKIVKGKNETDVLNELLKMLNEFNVQLYELSLENLSGEIHTVKVDNVDLEWESIIKMENIEKVKEESPTAKKLTLKKKIS